MFIQGPKIISLNHNDNREIIHDHPIFQDHLIYENRHNDVLKIELVRILVNGRSIHHNLF